MTALPIPAIEPVPQAKTAARSWARRVLDSGSYDLLVWVLLLIYLLPVAYMLVLAFKSDAQLEDSHAP
jgi:hypothetical protein